MLATFSPHFEAPKNIMNTKLKLLEVFSQIMCQFGIFSLVHLTSPSFSRDLTMDHYTIVLKLAKFYQAFFCTDSCQHIF